MHLAQWSLPRLAAEEEKVNRRNSMNNLEEVPHLVSKRGNASDSRLIVILLLILSLLYLLASVAAFVVVVAAPRNQANIQLRSELIRHGLQHALTTFVCAYAFFLILLKSRLSDLATGFAACMTGYFAIKALTSSLVTGFHLYHLIEPMIVLPSVILIAWKLRRNKLLE